MSTPTLIGRYAVIPASLPNENVARNFQLDLTDPYCLRLEIDGQPFAVSRKGLQALLDVYDDMQARVTEQLYESSCTGLSTGPSQALPNTATPGSTPS